MKSSAKKLATSFFAILLAVCCTLSLTVNAHAAAGYSSYAVTTPAGLNVRSGPGTNYSRVGSISGGSVVTVQRSFGNWVQIGDEHRQYGGCWICADYIEYAKGPYLWPDGKIKTPSGCGVYLRKGPSTSFSTIRLLPSGTKVTYWYDTSNWTKVSCSVGSKSYEGWVSRQYVKR